MLRGIVSVILGMLLQTGWTALHNILPPQPADPPSAASPASVSPAVVSDLTPPTPDQPFSVAGPFGVMLGGCGPVVAVNPQVILQAAATALGLTPDDLQGQLEAGQTLGQVADAQGVSRDTLTADIKDAATAELKIELDAAVQAGDITQAEADTRLADFQAQDFSVWLDQPFGLVLPGVQALPLPFGGGQSPLPGGGSLSVGLSNFGYSFSWQLADGAHYTFSFDDSLLAFRQAAADALGLSVDDLAARLDAGETLPDIAAAQNVTEQALSDALHAALLTAAQADVAAAVADGRLTQEQANQILDQIAQVGDGPVFTLPGMPGQLPEGWPPLPAPFGTPTAPDNTGTTY